MGFLDNSSITVDAILTKRGREILASGGDLAITKFALSDEEVDYTLWDVTHPNGTDSYGSVIENMSLLEATPARTNFRSFLVNQSLAGAQINIDQLNYSNVDTNTNITITPSTAGGVSEQYTFTIENTNIVKFTYNPASVTQTRSEVQLTTQSINPGATTTVTIIGVISGISKVVTISVKTDPASNNDPAGPKNRTVDTTQDASQYSGASGASGGNR